MKWTTSDYDRLFRDHPPTEPTAPHGDELAAIASDLHGSTGAIAAQWNDTRSAMLISKTAASGQLLGYLRASWLVAMNVEGEMGIDYYREKYGLVARAGKGSCFRCGARPSTRRSLGSRCPFSTLAAGLTTPNASFSSRSGR